MEFLWIGSRAVRLNGVMRHRGDGGGGDSLSLTGAMSPGTLWMAGVNGRFARLAGLCTTSRRTSTALVSQLLPHNS